MFTFYPHSNIDWIIMYVFSMCISQLTRGSSWLWSYGSWIYNFLCNQCKWPQTLWVRTLFIARCTRYNIMSVTCDRWVVFFGYSGFRHQWNWPQWYSWNIVESYVKHHKPTNQPKWRVSLKSKNQHWYILLTWLSNLSNKSKSQPTIYLFKKFTVST